MTEYRAIDEKDFPHSDVNSEFGALRSHVEFFEKSLNQEQQIFDANIKQRAEKILDEEELGSLYESVSHIARNLYDTFPQIQRHALFLLAYGTFERRLNLLCNQHFQDFSPELAVKDFSGKGIKRAQIYLSKVHDLKDPFRKKEWAEIKKINKLRNLIAHSSGELDLKNDTHKEVKQYCESRKDIVICGNMIELSPGFLFHSLDTFQKFLLLICKQYQVIKNSRL